MSNSLSQTNRAFSGSQAPPSRRGKGGRLTKFYFKKCDHIKWHPNQLKDLGDAKPYKVPHELKILKVNNCSISALL